MEVNLIAGGEELLILVSEIVTDLHFPLEPCLGIFLGLSLTESWRKQTKLALSHPRAIWENSLTSPGSCHQPPSSVSDLILIHRHVSSV